jgi:hypothetical protein
MIPPGLLDNSIGAIAGPDMGTRNIGFTAAESAMTAWI